MTSKDLPAHSPVGGHFFLCTQSTAVKTSTARQKYLTVLQTHKASLTGLSLFYYVYTRRLNPCGEALCGHTSP